MARPVYPTSEQIWTKAKAYKSTYFDDQNAILKDSIERARKQLADKYNANLTYVGYQKDLVEMYGNNIAAMQEGLNEYEKNKIPGKDGGSGAAALLKIVVDSAGNEQEATGKASQRRLDAQGQAEAGYNLSPAQSNEISKASSFAGTDLNNATSAADVKRKIDEAIASIPDGTFAPNADSSKTAASQLYAAMNSKLGASSMYASDPTLQIYLQQAVIGKMRVPADFITLRNVEVDKQKKMKTQGDTAASVGGIALGREAAKLAMEELNKNKDKKLDADDQTRIDEFMNSKYGQEYKRQIELGKTMPDAAIAVTNIITKDMGGANAASQFAKLKFANDIALTQNALSQGGDFDVYKYFDPVYTEKLAALKATQGKQTTAEQNFALGVTGLGDVPTEQQARRLGAEINRPLEPGYSKYLPEAQAALLNAQRTGTMRAPLLDKAGNPFRSPDDFLASRLMPPQPAAKQMSDAERITQLASRRAVANSPAFDYEGARAGDGFGLYNKVKGKSLEGGNTKENIVKAAAALAGDDQAKRDDILRDYYSFALKDMRALKPQTTSTPERGDPDEDGNVR
jgi:hypothetical protein